MADNEIDDRLDKDSTDGDESNEEKKGLSKPLIIKIAIGVTVLLIGIGSYFFFIPKDKPPEQESTSEADNLIESSDTAPDMAIKLLERREEAVSLREENLKLKQRIMELESQKNLNEESVEPEEDAKDNKATNIQQQSPDRKLNTDQYIVNYRDDPSDYSVRYGPKSVPPPKPKWGEFTPLYQGE